jgi:predicted nucleic acid-binding protein
MTCVIDNSWAAAYFMPVYSTEPKHSEGEGSPLDEESPEADSFFKSLTQNDKIIIPLLLLTEFTNVLKTAIRRKRITRDIAHNILAAFADYQFSVVAESGLNHSKYVLDTACKYDLTAYDATYLELAIREHAALATLDDELRAAAIKAGVELIDTEAK